MKRVYSKPDILFESFSLSTNIAACSKTATFSANICKVQLSAMNGFYLFTDSELGGCNITPTLLESMGIDWEKDLCYHAPHDHNNIFSS